MALKAGRICSSPTCGLRQRVVIEAKQVFDACSTKLHSENVVLNLSNFTPGTIPPFTFISAESAGNTTLNNLIITPMPEQRQRVAFDSVTPIVVSYHDANGTVGTATSALNLHRDVVLKMPPPALSVMYVEAPTALTSRMGTFIDNSTVSITCCILQNTKEMMTVDILVPMYAYAEFPACRDFAEDVCEGFFSLPLFPENI